MGVNMREKLIKDVENDITKLIDIYNKQDNMSKKIKALTSILELKQIIELTSEEHYKIQIKKDINYYKNLLAYYINLEKENREIYKTYDKNVLLEFYENNHKILKEYVDNNDYYNITYNNQFNINEILKLTNNFSIEYKEFINNYINKVYIIDNLSDVNTDGFINNIGYLNKAYCVTIPDTYIIYHELTHFYQEYISNYNPLLESNLYVEIFPNSMELILSKLLNSNYKNLILSNLNSLCEKMINPFKKLSIDDIKSFIGAICGIKLCEQYFEDKNKYFKNINFYSNNFHLFKSFENLELIDIKKEEITSKSLIKNFITNY